MQQSHYALRPLSGDKLPDREVFAQLSTSAAGRCVIFVHGYGGDPLETWSEFPDLLQSHPAIPRAIDYFYYGYDAIRDELVASAVIFRDFLHRLATDPLRVLKTIITTRADGAPLGPYSEIMCVAHSLGAVIVRRAIVDATMDHETWVQTTKMVFFAPAHCGASVVDLVKSARGTGLFGALLSIVQTAAQFHSPLVTQLAPGSPELLGLAEDVKQLRQNGANAHLSAKSVTIASREQIVRNIPFPLDPRPKAIPGSTHQSVCKPRADFLEPIEMLAKWM